MAKKKVRRRKGRRLLFVTLLGGAATWYVRSRQLAGASPSLADQPPAAPPAPTRPALTPRPAAPPRPAPPSQPAPTAQVVPTPQPEAVLATTVSADESPAAGALSGDTIIAAEGFESSEAEAEPTQEPQPLFTPAATAADSPTNGLAAAAEVKAGSPTNGVAAAAEVKAVESDPAAATAPQAVVDIPAEAAPSRPDGSSPGSDFTIKGNAGSKLFHLPTSPYYERTKAEMWFRTADEARAAGFTEWAPPKRARRKRVSR